MKYREFGKTGIRVSALGFGAMRLPVTVDGLIEEEKAVGMIRHAIDEGVNYVDTAYPYHHGESERIVGMALSDGYREKTYLATKCPVWQMKQPEDFEVILKEQLEKLKTDHIDFYLLHALNRERFDDQLKRLGLIDKMEKARHEGKIKYLGFSFHDHYDVFQDIIDSYDGWDFCQIQYNYVDIEHQAGLKGLKYAAGKGLGVIVMEPLLGGKLANPAKHLRAVFPEGKSPVEFALDFIWDQKEVGLLLSGMSELAQVEENLIYADRSRTGMVNEQEKRMYQKAREIYTSMALVGCTGCGYCMPCPYGINIPEIFSAYNMTVSAAKEAAKRYQAFEHPAHSCRSCHRCEKECPQGIQVSEMMKEASGVFAGIKL